MSRTLTIAAAALLAGCSLAPPGPSPGIVPPPEDTPAVVETARVPVPDESPPAPVPAAPQPPRQEVPGRWLSSEASGPCSAGVLRVEMAFEEGGAYAGTMLIESGARKRFVSLDGTWTGAGSELTVTFRDGRARTWAVSWDGAILILRDGEAELVLRRMPE